MGTILAHQHLRPALLFLLACQIYALGLPSETPEATYRASVSEVRLTFSATDRNNHAVATLNAADLAIVDKDLIVRNFQSFTRAEFTQLEVTILIDASGSTAPRFRQEVAEALELISGTAGVPDENVSVISFHGLEPTLICKGDCRASRVEDWIPATSPRGLTPLFDTLAFAANSFSRAEDPQTRRVLILFSDGEDTISRTSAPDVIDALLSADIQVYTVGLNPADYPDRGTVFLRNLAAATGARSFHLNDGADRVVHAVLEDFHASYQITYRLPVRSAGFHSTRILPTRDLNLHFHCRQGYYYPAGNR